MLSYTNFIQWKNSKNANSFSENVFMAYFNEVEKFIKEAPDSQYLATKVTEGGVTRQVARAMEVLHASAPGARVRVVRAAYHSSSGPGAPASSYMMHSSRRVISSGTRLLSPSLTSRPFGDTPSQHSLPSLPLEISSTPLEPDTAETENYKVTEPDDSEISAPSKWKGSTGKNSIRMPSEESSSTDNASIIDLDPRTNHKSVFRKYSYDSENSDISTMKAGSRASPLLDTPVALSTLKYKSLLNGSNDWNNRRKSYSFEETAPLNESISHSNGTMTMESSTDSGICKSSEIVNDYTESEKHDRKYDTHEDSFKDWLNKNRQTSFNKSNSFKSRREHNVVIEEPSENSVTLQSAGKVSITLPITLETDDDYQYKKGYSSEEMDKRVKKVEFCKTELHFAAESGKVNIIATDEKPPPTNDFRRKKSAFMPIISKPERPITLFGEHKTKAGDVVTVDELFSHNTSEVESFDENTAATKSILKNKIPKPKPYLLGENMAFGLIDDSPSADKISAYKEEAEVPTAVSIINRQLQTERRYSNDTTSSLSSEFESSGPKKIVSRPINAGLTKSVSSKIQENNTNQYMSTTSAINSFDSAKNKFKSLQMSPTPSRSKTRQLRQSDLTYFGIQNEKNNATEDKPKFIRDRIKMHNDAIDNIFQSVRLIQQVSNSVCNSEAESEDAVEYQNVPFKSNYAPVPTPRSRTKYINKSEQPEKVTILKPIIEQESKVIKQENHVTRRARSRKYEEVNSPTMRSISEPPKTNIFNSMGKSHRHHNYIQQNASTRINKFSTRDEVNNNKTLTPDTAKLYLSEEDEDDLVPTYVNLIKDGVDYIKEVIGETVTPNVLQNSNNKNDLKINDLKENNRNQCNSYDRIHKAEIHKGSYNNKTNSIKKKKLPQKVENLDVQNSDPQSSEHLSISRKLASQENKHRVEKNKTVKKHNGSLRHPEKNASERPERVTEHVNNVQYKKVSKDPECTDEVLKPQHVSSTSRRSTKKDLIGHQKRSSINSTDRHQNTLQIKSSERNGEMRHSKDRSRSKRNEYVINYDDKNGTVTSICKVSTDPRLTKMKKTSLEKIKDSPKEQKSHNKIPEKINLLQFPDRERNPSGLSHAHKRLKTKMHIQRSCQLL